MQQYQSMVLSEGARLRDERKRDYEQEQYRKMSSVEKNKKDYIKAVKEKKKKRKQKF